MPRIEALLSARLFISPQLVGDRLYFMSDLSGRLSLYAMDARPGGSVPEPLLPPHLALQNPHIGGTIFYVFPKLGKILIKLDKDGDENYQPMLIPLTGGFPEPAFGDQLVGYRAHIGEADAKRNIIYFVAESRSESVSTAFRGYLETGRLEKLGQSQWGFGPDGISPDHSTIILSEGYTFGDNVLYRWAGEDQRELLYGTPLEQRQEGQTYQPAALFGCHFTPSEKGLVLATALYEDAYGLGYLAFDNPSEIKRVAITGQVHTGAGELTNLDHLHADRYRVDYNIDGCSWVYEGVFDEHSLTMTLDKVICGTGGLANGVLESASYEKASGTYALSFATATSATQIYTVRNGVTTAHTRERVLGLPDDWLSPGEDASFTSHDGVRVSARLYRPAPGLGFSGPRPLVYYIHGGPQGQERPDFAWFSMPLIQFLTLSGFAVFVPNVRGSSGYGLSYMKKVDRDWGGQDRLDHVHAMTQVLPQDARIDVKRAGVTGRSYGGYMTLTLATRHPELWAAAVDMFGPYNLITAIERLPETWKPYFRIAVGDPEKDQAFLTERSPQNYIANLTAPLFVIQGQNDPRVIERESRDVVEQLRATGKTAEYLVFENEGHDVLKYENKVRCYNAITDFFKTHLKP